MSITVKVGDVVGVRGDRGTVNAFVFRTFTNGEFRAIPETHRMYRDVLGWYQVGNISELKAHQVEIEYMSRTYSPSELRDDTETIPSRFTDPAYLKCERSVARSAKAIRRSIR